MWTVRDRHTYQALRKSPIRVHRGRFMVSWVAGDPAEPPRVGYAVGRRVGGAVDRNLVRRRLRSVIHEMAPTMAAGAYLVSAGAGARAVPFATLRHDVEAALKAVAERARSVLPPAGEESP